MVETKQNNSTSGKKMLKMVEATIEITRCRPHRCPLLSHHFLKYSFLESDLQFTINIYAMKEYPWWMKVGDGNRGGQIECRKNKGEVEEGVAAAK
jgi:hypothetical protein